MVAVCRPRGRVGVFFCLFCMHVDALIILKDSNTTFVFCLLKEACQ